MSEIVVAVDQTRAQGVLGASEAAGALGLDPWKPPLTVHAMLRGEHVEETKGEAAEWGTILEPVVRGKYALKSLQVVGVPPASFVRGNLRATPDGLLFGHGIGRVVELDGNQPIDKLVEEFVGLLQVKTASAYLDHEWADGKIPPRYEVQVRVEMHVTGLPWCDVVCLVGGQKYVGPVRVHRDLAIESKIVADLEAFIARARAGILPETDASDAWRAWAADRMERAAVTVQATPAMNELFADWRAARGIKAHAIDQEKRLANKVLRAMAEANATAVESAHGRVSAYKAGGRTDWKGYAQALAPGPAPAQYVKPSTTWTPKAPRAWGGDDEA